MFFFENRVGIDRAHSNETRKHWKALWDNQTKERREKRRDTSNKSNYDKRGIKTILKPSALEEIQDWTFEEMLEHMGRFDNRCVVTGIPLGCIKLQCDRIHVAGTV